MPSLTPLPATYLRPVGFTGGEQGLTGRYYPTPPCTGVPAFERIDPQIDFIWKDTNPLNGAWGGHFAICWEGVFIPPCDGLYHLGANGFSAYRLFLDDELVVENKQEHHPVQKSRPLSLEGGRCYQLRLEYSNEGLDPQIQLLWSPPDVDYAGRALAAAAKAEVVIMVMGLSAQLEGEEMPIQIPGFAGGDRTDLRLPAVQEHLLQQVHALGKPVVLLLLNGSALAINWAAEHVPAIVEAWYPGQAGGTAVADVLFGDYNPAGRLPVTFYRSVEDLPPFTDYGLSGRTYRYFTGDPLYPFGFGLSFTQFTYERLEIGPKQIEPGETVNIQICVRNSGGRDGDEVVQLYVRGEEDGRTIPQLIGLQRLSVPAGAQRTVIFMLHSHQLGRYNEGMRYTVQPQTVTVAAGRSAADCPLIGQFTISGATVDATDKKQFFSQTSKIETTEG